MAGEPTTLSCNRNEALNELGLMTGASIGEICDFALQKGIELTRSEIGYLYFYDEDTKLFTLHAWSKEAMEECATTERQTVYELDKTGLWGEVVRQRKAMIVNDYSAPSHLKKGYPQGHVKLDRFLSVPVFDKGRIVAVIGVANKEDPYDEADVQQLKLFSEGTWRVVERIRAEQELKKSEARLANAQRIAHLGNWNWNIIKGDLWWSDEIYRIFGLKEQEFGATFEAFISTVHPEDREFVKKSVNEALSGEKSYSIDHRIVLPDGSVRFVHEQAEVIFDAYGKPQQMDGTVQDITDRKRAEEELLRAKQVSADEAKISSNLLNLSTSISSLLDAKVISQEVSAAVHKLTSADKAAVFLKDEYTGDFKTAAIHGLPASLMPVINDLRLSKGSMPSVDALLRGESIRIDNARSINLLDGNLTGSLELNALLMTPIVTGEGVMGAILVERQKPFVKRDEDVVRGVSIIASTSIENAMLYRESMDMATDLARRMETVETTYAIDRAILSTLDTEEILEVVAKNIQRIIPADKLISIVFDEENKSYSFDSQNIPFGSSQLLDSVLRTGRISSVPDLGLHKHKYPVISDLTKEGYGSIIVLPLFAKERRFGCIVMAGKRVGAFDKEDIANAEKLTAQMSIALENAKLYADIKDLFMSTVRALAHAIDAKSAWTSGHSERVTEYSVALAEKIGLPASDIDELQLAGLLHDIGKIGTYDVLLDKPDKLNDKEFALVKKHPAKGAEILQNIKQMKAIIPAVRHHHEKLDGTGYPDGIKGEDIPLHARILCIADSYDSMTADRPYRPAPGKDYAISELKRCAGTQFDPDLVNAFLRLLERE